jgi:hypothetical protein
LELWAKLESTAGPLQLHLCQSTDVWTLASSYTTISPRRLCSHPSRSDPSFPRPSSGLPGRVPIPHQRYFADSNVPLPIDGVRSEVSVKITITTGLCSLSDDMQQLFYLILETINDMSLSCCRVLKLYNKSHSLGFYLSQ